MAAVRPLWPISGRMPAAPYKGATIRGVSESTPPSNYVKDVIAPAFTQATGINVEFEATSWDQMYDKAIKDMEANTGIYDFVYIEQDIIYSYLSRNFLVDITQSLKDNSEARLARLQGRGLHLLHRLLQGRRTATSSACRWRPSSRSTSIARICSPIRRPRKPSRPNTATTSPRRRPTPQYRDIAEFFTQWGKDNGQELWGTTVQAHSGHPSSWYEFFESWGPTFGVYNWGINAENNYARVGRQRRLDEWPGSQGCARILARAPQVRAAGIDAEHLGRGRGDLRRRPRRSGPRLCRERGLDRDQCRQEQGRRQCRHHPAAARRRRDGGRGSRTPAISATTTAAPSASRTRPRTRTRRCSSCSMSASLRSSRAGRSPRRASPTPRPTTMPR